MIRSIFISLLLLNLFGLNAQTPSAFKYQTSVRDNTGKILANKLVSFKLSLLQGNENGTAVYAERHSLATNDFGVANLNVGGGTVLQGVFNNIDWANGPYFLKIELDLNNGTNYVFMGTSQLLSVPYALYAGKSANAADDKDKDSTNEIQNVILSGNNLQLSKNGGAVDLSKYATDSQSLTLSGNTLSISRGNSVVFDDRDKDSTNEIQNISLSGNNLQLSKNGGTVDLAKYATDSQSLSLNGNTLSISRGNSIVLSGAVDLDADPTNEIQNLTIVGDSLKISKGNGIKLPKDNDTDSTNEIQSLSLVNDTLKLTGANNILLPKNNDNDSTNELQALTLSGDTLKLSQNGGKTLLVTPNTIQSGSLLYCNASGFDSIILTVNPPPTQYKPGMMLNFKVINNNTGKVRVNLNGLGYKEVLKNINTSLELGDFKIGQMVSIIYDGSSFQIILSPFALSANNANKIKNDTAGGLVPNGTMIISNRKDNLNGYSIKETLKIPTNIEILTNAPNSGAFSLYNNKIYFANNYFDIDSNKYKTKPTTSFTSTTSAQINNELIIVPGSISANTQGSLNSYNLITNTVGIKNGVIPSMSYNTNLEIYKINSNFIITRSVQTPSFSAIYFYNYNLSLDTVTLITGNLSSGNNTGFFVSVLNNELYILTTGNAFYKCTLNGLTTLAGCSACSSNDGALFSTNSYVVKGNNVYSPLTNSWATKASNGWIGNLIGVCGDFAYYVNQSGNPEYLHIYERDLSLNGTGLANRFYQETGSGSSNFLNYTAFNSDKLIITRGGYLYTIYPSKTKYLYLKN